MRNSCQARLDFHTRSLAAAAAAATSRMNSQSEFRGLQGLRGKRRNTFRTVVFGDRVVISISLKYSPCVENTRCVINTTWILEYERLLLRISLSSHWPEEKKSANEKTSQFIIVETKLCLSLSLVKFIYLIYLYVLSCTVITER